jgi:drug/metabolite transporter, DME family
LPLAAALGGPSFRPGPEAVGLLIALGTGPTAVAYTLYFRGLRVAAASTAALLTLLEPLTGAVLAAFVLGQRLSATGIAGAAVLIAAVIVTVCGGSLTRRRPVTAPPPRHRGGAATVVRVFP